MKTPHNTVKHGSSNTIKKSGQQQSTQRRRRALGDISNKNGGSAAKGNSGKNGSNGGIGGGGSLALKPLSLNNNQGGLRSNKSKNRQVKFSKSGSGIKSVSKQPLSSSSSSTKLLQKKQSSSSSEEYDGIFGVTTRWSTTHQDHDRPSPLEQLSDKDEFDLSTRVAEEIRQHRLKERVRKEKVEEERMEERLRMKRDVLFDGDDENKNDDVEDGLQQLLTNHFNIVEEEEQEALWELKTSPAWGEKEEEEFDPAKERRLSGNDPVSLWGDVLSP